MHKESNQRLEFFKSYIGKSLSESISPLGAWLNGTVKDVQPDSMTIDYVVRRDMSNPMGVLHGGAAAAIMDDIVGMMVFALGREYGFTSINLNCDFLSPAYTGDTITATTNVIRAGKNVIHCEAKITNAEGKIISKCATNLGVTTVKIPF